MRKEMKAYGGVPSLLDEVLEINGSRETNALSNFRKSEKLQEEDTKTSHIAEGGELSLS